MGRKSAILALASAAMVLAGCASKGVVVGDDGDADGRTLTAKAGLARLYLVHGYILNGEDSGGVFIAGGPAALVGAAIGTAIREASAAPDPDDNGPHPVAGEFFLNGQDIGRVAKGQYLAIDLMPGDYVISYDHLSLITRKSAAVPLKLTPGQVVYLSSDYDVKTATAVLSPCLDPCQARVKRWHRTVANWGMPK